MAFIDYQPRSIIDTAANGLAEPTTWAMVTSDATPALQAAGDVGAEARLPPTATNAPVTFTFDGLTVSAVR